MNPSHTFAHRAPGCSNRPELSSQEAALLTAERYLAQGGLFLAPEGPWHPEPINCSQADFTVGSGGTHATLQAAINAAIRRGPGPRQFIRLLPGHHAGAAYIPAEAPPLTIYGAGETAADVSLELCLDACMSTAEYIARVNSANQIQPGDPAWAMYQACADRDPDLSIETPCTAVLWSQAKDLQLAHFTIVNSLLDSVGAGTHQAVALRCDADRTHLEGMRLIGRQDTFFCNAGEAPSLQNRQGAYPTDRWARVYAHACYIEGDADYVFGRATAVFERCQFHSVSSRRQTPAIVFAPSTLADSSLGFLAIECRFTGDAWLNEQGRSHLGRSWDQGASPSGYRPGITANGQVLIRDSIIDASYDPRTPWSSSATTRRPYRGNTHPARDLNDPAFNRLWEFNNRWPDASTSAG